MVESLAVGPGRAASLSSLTCRAGSPATSCTFGSLSVRAPITASVVSHPKRSALAP